MRFWGRIAIFVAIFLSLDVVVSWFAFCHPYDEATTQYQTQHEYCALGGPFIGVVSWGWSWLITLLHHRDKEIVAAFTVILTLSTLALWTATRDAARGGERAANIAEQALTRLERAVVFCETFVPHGEATASRVLLWKLHAKWFNSGSTVANNLAIHINWDHFSDGLPENFDFPDHGTAGAPPLYLGPKATLLSQPILMPPEIIDAVNQRHIRFFIWGWAEYDDVFDNTPRHRTEFCVELLGSAGDPYVPFAHNEFACQPTGPFNTIS
jgi:hypothetical protein